MRNWKRIPSESNYDAMEDAFKDLRIAKDEQIAAAREHNELAKQLNEEIV
jgi:hypothetical protein